MTQMFRVQKAYPVSVTNVASVAKQVYKTINYKITNKAGGDDVLIVWGNDNTVSADNTVTSGSYPDGHAFVAGGSIQTLRKDVNADWFSVICLTGTADVVIEVGEGE